MIVKILIRFNIIFVLSTVSLFSNSYNFNNCNSTGAMGPSLSDCEFYYAGTTLEGNISIESTGIQVWTVPESGQYKINTLTDFQIVNGGQTTSSIYAAFKKEGVSLKEVYVQMKLSEIKEKSMADEIVPEISRCANSQNKVKCPMTKTRLSAILSQYYKDDQEAGQLLDFIMEKQEVKVKDNIRLKGEKKTE